MKREKGIQKTQPAFWLTMSRRRGGPGHPSVPSSLRSRSGCFGGVGPCLRGEAAFTLIELLTVIAIIGVLAGVLIPVIIKMAGASKKAEARSTMGCVELAIEQFKLDNNQYPWPPPPATPDPLVSADVIRELITDDPRITAGVVPQFNRAGRSYLSSLKDEHIKGGTLVDPWGHPYSFRWNAVAEKLLIYSWGENGLDEDGGGDDLANQ